MKYIFKVIQKEISNEICKYFAVVAKHSIIKEEGNIIYCSLEMEEEEIISVKNIVCQYIVITIHQHLMLVQTTNK